MTLDEAKEYSKKGYSIRVPEMGYQVLIPQDEDAKVFRMSASFFGPYLFTDFDRARTDWQVVGLDDSSQIDAHNPVLEADFDPPAKEKRKK